MFSSPLMTDKNTLICYLSRLRTTRLGSLFKDRTRWYYRFLVFYFKKEVEFQVDLIDRRIKLCRQLPNGISRCLSVRFELLSHFVKEKIIENP